MLSTSRYVLNGSPHNCAFCREPLKDEAYRSGGRYFCNELCVDAATKPARTGTIDQQQRAAPAA